MKTRFQLVASAGRAAGLAFKAMALCWPLAGVAGNEDLSDREKIIHVLDRLGYGPRPGDVERVERMGLDHYLDLQLHPERIDVAASESQLAELRSLSLDSRTLMDGFATEIRRAVERQRAGDKDKKPMPSMRERLMDPSPAVQAVGELQTAKIARAVESEAQLFELLADFWSNHFNVDVKKGPVRALKVADEREVIRPHVFGKFRDLLGASAHSPAMLFYLDNVLNSAPREVSVMEQRFCAKDQQRRFGQPLDAEMAKAERPTRIGGLNENYGRELMELHTLGVDGGYAQQDVIEVSRCFTGWGMDRDSGRFQFNVSRHDQGGKTVLGRKIPPNGGIRDGEMVLDILASHPSTAKFIATKLCQRLVADEPPQSVVDLAARTFTATNGDLRKVVETIITSCEFFSPEAFRAKIKSPFEYAISVVRAVGGHINLREPGGPDMAALRYKLAGAASIGLGGGNRGPTRSRPLNMHIADMGQQLYSYAAPTGWPEDSRKWVSSGALISRLNFALGFTSGDTADVSAQPRALLEGVDAADVNALLDHLEKIIVPAGLSPATRKTLQKQAPAPGSATTANVPQLAALMLGSPEFQRR